MSEGSSGDIVVSFIHAGAPIGQRRFELALAKAIEFSNEGFLK